MKKTLCALLALTLMLCLFSACGAKKPEGEQSDKLTVVTTVFPLYDWTRAILGDKADDYDLSMLTDSGVDLHNFQPTAEDILKIGTADLFIYVGGESDKWVEDVLKESVSDRLAAVNLLEALGDRAQEEEHKEGMEEEAEEEEDEGPAYDEHIWLSLKNAAFLCGVIEEKLEALTPENADALQANAEAYTQKLNALDAAYQAAVDAAPVKTLLFGDRFPFLYLTKDYGLDYFAAFMGCSAESEASFKTISGLAAKVDELGLRHVMKIETGDGTIAETIVANTKTKDQKILTMYSLQSITAQDIGSGVNYLGEMEKNLEVLKEALQ